MQRKQAIRLNKHVLSPYEPDFMLGWGLGGKKKVSIPAVQPSHIDCYKYLLWEDHFILCVEER